MCTDWHFYFKTFVLHSKWVSLVYYNVYVKQTRYRLTSIEYFVEWNSSKYIIKKLITYYIINNSLGIVLKCWNYDFNNYKLFYYSLKYVECIQS